MKQSEKNSKSADPVYWVYLLLCSNGHYYTGQTTHLIRRYREHVAGTAKCKYTRSFKPVCLAQSWPIWSDQSTVLAIERFIKQMSRQEKEMLVLFPEQLMLQWEKNGRV